MWKYLAAGVLWALSVTGASAEGTIRPLLTADDSRGFEAVGRIQLDERSFCTGTLIGETLVLTAAHCLFDARTAEQRDLSAIEFRAGWRDGRALAYRSVRRAIIHPDYTSDPAREGTARVVNDLALLELDRPIRGNGVTPFATAGNPRLGDPVAVVSYAVHREERPSFEEACKVLARPARIIVISCTVDFGASGAPILSFADGRPRIVSVVSAKAESMGRPVALGVDIDGSIERLMDLARTRPAAEPAPAAMRLTSGHAAQAAKFVRP